MLLASEASGVEQFKTRTIEKLRGVRCPIHHQAPRLRFEGATLHDVRISMSACCEGLAEMANRAIALPGPETRS